MTEHREPLPADLLAAIIATAREGILAGCTADEIIMLCKQTVNTWVLRQRA